MKGQDEMFEAATELPAFMGCPALGPKTLPSGFDGVERGTETVPPHKGDAQGGAGVSPAHVSEENRKKLEDSYLAMRGRLEKIADIALAADAKCGVSERIGANWRTCSKAIGEIRRICKQTFAEEIEAEASKRPIEYPTFFTPGWLCELAKKLEADGSGSETLPPQGEDERGAGVPPAQRKPTMDFGRFHVTRAAIPGRTVLTFRRKQEHLPEFGAVVPGRIIVANISRNDNVGKTVYDFSVKSYMSGELPRVLFSGVSQVSMSKTEKIVYKMVKCDIKETQRRHIRRKRKAAAKQQAHDNKAAAAASGSETLPPQGEGSRGGAVSAAQKEVK